MNQRKPLLDALDAYRATHPEEASVVDRIAALAETHPDCFERTCRPGHLTGSAWVVSSDGRRHLLLLHKKLGKWLQPGGHADGDPDLARVALREAAEETGLSGLQMLADPSGLEPLDVDVHQIPRRIDPHGILVEDAHEHHDVRYLIRACADDTLVLSDESHELRWCTAEQVLALTPERSVLRLLHKALARLDALRARRPPRHLSSESEAGLPEP